jgi:anaerobic nitric oxide reductase flavorubredoxin
VNPVEVKPGIFWIGAVDWAIRDFHGYITPHGSTYNNYVVDDEDITLVDTLRYEFAEVGIKNLKKVVDPSRIKNLIVNHIENDHSGSMAQIMSLMPDVNIYITDRGKQGLARFFDISDWNINVVKSGDELKIGRYTLQFLETPMLHWPDSMMTYVREAKLLISQDAFGQHLATTARFDDEFIECASVAELNDAVVDYYANILMPFGKLVRVKLDEIEKLGLEIDTIAPDHGIIWRSDPGRVMKMYRDMATGKARLRVPVIFDTMWRSTEIMADPIAQGIKDEGVESDVIKLRSTPMSVAIKEVWKSRGFLVGSPTLNNEVFPSVGKFMIHLRGLRPTDRIAGAFGSYGWGGGATRWLYGEFEHMKLKTMEPGMQVKFRPDPEDMSKCYEFGREFARQVIAYHNNYLEGEDQ